MGRRFHTDPPSDIFTTKPRIMGEADFNQVVNFIKLCKSKNVDWSWYEKRNTVFQVALQYTKGVEIEDVDYQDLFYLYEHYGNSSVRTTLLPMIVR